MGCGSSSETKHSPNAPRPAEVALSNEASRPYAEQQPEVPMLPAPPEPPHAPITPEPQSGDVAMLSKEDLADILKCMDEEERNRRGEELGEAAAKGDLEELARLLSTDKGSACINEKGLGGDPPLRRAANRSKLQAVKLLVERGAEVDSVSSGLYGGTSLTGAATYGYERIAEYLLSKGGRKEKAIESAPDDQKALVERFFVELERVIESRQEFKIERDELNATMMSSQVPETLPTTCKGITIGGLRTMKALIQAECEIGRFKEDKSFLDGTHCKGTMKYEELTTTDIVYQFVKDESVTDNLRLIDKPGIVAPEHKALPTFFISHAWKGRFSVLLDKILEYIEKHGLSDETAVWIDVFSVNQHGSDEFSHSQNQADVKAFNKVVQTCIDGTLVVCDFVKCETQSRAWCLFEWDWTMFYHGREKLQFLGISKAQAELGKDKIDVEMAECFKPEDKEMILREIRVKHGSTYDFNNKLKNKWIDVQYGFNS